MLKVNRLFPNLLLLKFITLVALGTVDDPCIVFGTFFYLCIISCCLHMQYNDAARSICGSSRKAEPIQAHVSREVGYVLDRSPITGLTRRQRAAHTHINTYYDLE